ncbi:PaaI family thioesterase [Streptosporangium sp. CA-115845]|uniref:PaaI family thioesterase n=1 Tax=Streptosporangium sp. CA-115845 TaxID=3240071 RepID=UPI003D93F007
MTSAPPGPAGSASRLRAAATLRRLTERFLCHDVDDEALDELAATLDGLTGQLAAGAPRRRSFAEIVTEPDAPEIADGGVVDHYDQCFVTGAAHPAGLAATVRRRGGAIELRTRIPVTFEGMPGYAHGGVLAAVFDDLIGLMTGRVERVPAPTVQLEVTFRRPVPLDTPVCFRAELTGADGRKRTVTVSAWVGETLHATATGILVVLTAEQLANMSG